MDNTPITKSLLLGLLSNHKWDIIDHFMTENNDNFYIIGNIFNETLSKGYTIERLSFVAIFSSLIFLTRFMLNETLTDTDLRRQAFAETNTFLRMTIEKQYNYSEYIIEIKSLLSATSNYKVVSLMMGLFADDYHNNDELFLNKVADYIMLQINANNVSVEFLSYLTSLI